MAKKTAGNTTAANMKKTPESAPVKGAKGTSKRGPASPPDQPTQSDGQPTKLSALAAAAQVLGETKRAMSCTELIETMLAKGYWQSPKGKTPSATLSAAIQREITHKGEKARFAKAAPGRFSLA